MAEQPVVALGPERLDLRLMRLRTPTAPAITRMAASLEKSGQLTPLIAYDEGNCPILIDGFKRLAAARALGLATLLVMIVPAGTVRAKALIYLMNRSGGFSLLQEALLLRELVDIDGLTQSEAASLLERHKSWVSRRLDLLRGLAPEIQEDLSLELLPAGSALSLARLPHCIQADFATAIQTHKLVAREISRLVDLWCKAPEPGARQYLLAAPRQALDLANGKDDGQPEPRRLRLLRTLRRQIVSVFVTLASDLKIKTLTPEEAAHFEELLTAFEKTFQNGLARIRQQVLERTP